MENKSAKIENKKAVVMVNDRINGLFSAKVISYPDNAGFPWGLVQKKNVS